MQGRDIVDLREVAAYDSGGARATKGSMWNAAAGSLAMHAAALVLLVLFHSAQETAPVETIVPVDLVVIGEKTATPASSQVAALPQEQAHESATTQSVTAVPTPATPKQTVKADETRKTLDAKKPAVTSAAKKPERLSPTEALAARLRSLAQLREPSFAQPPSPRQQEGTGQSSVTAADRQGHGSDALYAVKDLIRTQVERRWNLDESVVGAKNWTVSIRITLDARGRVLAARIVDDRRLQDDSAYRDFALSARNAVLLSSPLQLPSGVYDIAGDIVVEFDSRQMLR